MTHETLVTGDFCPNCDEGIVYRQKDWRIVVRLVGRPPVGGARYELERLRCNLCGNVFTAQLPSDAGTAKYDPNVVSTLATLHYGYGMPWNRLEQIQAAANIPLPASTQYELAARCDRSRTGAVFQQLLVDAAQGDLVHNDDTTMRVLELSAKKKQGQPILESDPKRRGVYTTSILSMADDRPIIALFFTGARVLRVKTCTTCSPSARRSCHHRSTCATVCPAIFRRSEPRSWLIACATVAENSLRCGHNSGRK